MCLFHKYGYNFCYQDSCKVRGTLKGQENVIREQSNEIAEKNNTIFRLRECIEVQKKHLQHVNDQLIDKSLEHFEQNIQLMNQVKKLKTVVESQSQDIKYANDGAERLKKQINDLLESEQNLINRLKCNNTTVDMNSLVKDINSLKEDVSLIKTYVRHFGLK